jgi:hypothetical protein
VQACRPSRHSPAPCLAAADVVLKQTCPLLLLLLLLLLSMEP